MHHIAEITEDCRKADPCIFGNFAGDESLSYGRKDPAQPVPRTRLIRPTFQWTSSSIAFLFRNHTLWDLDSRTSNALRVAAADEHEALSIAALNPSPSFLPILPRSDRCPISVESAFFTRTNPRDLDTRAALTTCREDVWCVRHVSRKRLWSLACQCNRRTVKDCWASVRDMLSDSSRLFSADRVSVSV